MYTYIPLQCVQPVSIIGNKGTTFIKQLLNNDVCTRQETSSPLIIQKCKELYYYIFGILLISRHGIENMYSTIVFHSMSNDKYKYIVTLAF